MPIAPRRAVSLALSLCLLSACGGNRDASSGDETRAGSPTAESTPEDPLATATKPRVTVPEGPPPSEFQTRDLVVGTGPEAKAGTLVTVHYVGVAFSTKRQFDASWDRGDTFSFRLGVGDVIQGWDQGVAGMKVGGRRELIIPPALGYGDQGAGSDIKPGETLVFVVDLISVR